MQDKLSMVKQFMDIHSQEQRGQLETAQAKEAAMRTSMLPERMKAEQRSLDIQEKEQNRLLQRQAFEAEQAGKAYEAQNRILPNTEIEVYRSQAPKGYADLWKSGMTQAQADAILGYIKAIEGVRTTEAKTPDVVDWKAIVDANTELTGAYPSKEGVQTRLDLLKQKAVEDKNTDLADRYQSMIDWTEARQAETEAKTEKIKAETNAIKEGKTTAGGVAGGKIDPYRAARIRILTERFGYDQDSALAMSGPGGFTVPSLMSTINSLTTNMPYIMDIDEKAKAEEQLKGYQELLSTYMPQKVTEDQTVSVPYSDYAAWTKDQRINYLRVNGNMGTRRINIVDPDDKVIQTIDIKESPHKDGYDTILKDAKGNVILNGRVDRRQQTKTTQPTAKPAQKPAVQAKPTQNKPTVKPTVVLTEEQKRALLDKLAGE
jgi:hypothetical protein